MKKFRIVKETTYNDEKYYVQKRFLGFLWWYDIANHNFCTLGGAREALQMLLYKPKRTVIDEV